jgi:predicted nucleotidyltransferase
MAMSRLATALRDLQTELARLDVAWALAGGLAVSVRTEPRFTRDIDVAVVVDDDPAAERIIFALRHRGYTITATVEHLTAGRLATARLTPPGEPEGGILIDLLLASSGVEAEIVAAAERLEVFPGVTVPVCTAAHLVVLKLLARDDDARPQDRVDSVTLARRIDDAAWRDASRLAALIHDRGYDRGRDLAAALAELRGAATG